MCQPNKVEVGTRQYAKLFSQPLKQGEDSDNQVEEKYPQQGLVQ